MDGLQPEQQLQKTDAKKKVALVIGAGDATGGEIAKRFARGGYIACMTRRNAEKLQPLIAEIEAEGGLHMALLLMHVKKSKSSLW
jgi:NAD(P)-dependent dehydrogenase (short-subunit alcohol dehydrogenase family)